MHLKGLKFSAGLHYLKALECSSIFCVFVGMHYKICDPVWMHMVFCFLDFEDMFLLWSAVAQSLFIAVDTRFWHGQ